MTIRSFFDAIMGLGGILPGNKAFRFYLPNTNHLRGHGAFDFVRLPVWKRRRLEVARSKFHQQH